MDLLLIWVLAFLILAALAFLLRGSRLLSVCPCVRKDVGRLTAWTSWRGWLLSLTLLHRRVVVDSARREIIIDRRVFWIIRRRRVIPFGEVEAIIYSYEDWGGGTSSGFTGEAIDLFAVKLRLHSRETVHLFYFFGEGGFVHGGSLDWFPEWWYWPRRLLDASGSQENDSRAFVDRLQNLLDVEVRR